MSGLPAGWHWTTLGKVADGAPRSITDGPFGSNLTSAHYTAEGPIVVRLQNIGDGRYVYAPAHISPAHFESLRQHEVLPGDLLVASLGEILPRACLAPADLGSAIVKADCVRVRLSGHVEARWILYALQVPSTRRWAEEHRHGVGRPRLGLKGIRALPVPLAPLSEQRRIVDILEDHLSRLDAADAYGAMVLQRSNSLRVAAILKNRLIDTAPTVPLHLVLREPLTNGRSVPSRDGGFPVLRLTALRSQVLDLAERKGGAWDSRDAAPYLVQAGDYFVSRGNGSIKLVAKGALLRQQPDPVAFPDTMVRIRVDPAALDPEYLDLVWNSPIVRRQVEAGVRTTAGIYKVNQRQLEAVSLPVPELASQRRVLAELDAVNTAVGALRRAAEQQAARSRALRHSLLTAAFSGRLTGRSNNVDLVEEPLASSASR